MLPLTEQAGKFKEMTRQMQVDNTVHDPLFLFC